MANVATIRDALKTNLSTVSGLNVYDTVPDKPEPPCAIVQPDTANFIIRETMAKGVVSLHFVVTVLVGRVVDDAAQDNLDAYLKTSGTGSIWAALESDTTGGGAASDIKVANQAVRNYGGFTFNEITYLGAEFVVAVLATG